MAAAEGHPFAFAFPLLCYPVMPCHASRLRESWPAGDPARLDTP